MRVPVADIGRIRQVQGRIKIMRIAVRGRLFLYAKPDGGAGGLFDQAVRRIERGGSRLRDIGHPVSPVTAHLFVRHLGQINPVKTDRTASDPASGLRIAHRCKAKG